MSLRGAVGVAALSLTGATACGGRSELLLGTGAVDSVVLKLCYPGTAQQGSLIIATMSHDDLYVPDEMKCSGNASGLIGAADTVQLQFPSPLTQPGSFVVGPPSSTVPPSTPSGAVCATRNDCTPATSGTVTLTSLTADEMVGSYTLKLDGGVTTSGTFTAAVCNFPCN